MMPRLSALTVVLLAALSLSLSSEAGDKESPIRDRDFEMEVVVIRNTDKNGNYISTNQMLETTVVIKSRTVSDDYTGLTAQLYVIGESVSRGRTFCMLHKHEKTFDLPGREEVSYSAGVVPVTYLDKDHYYSGYGFKYETYVLVLRDSDGLVIDTKTTRRSFAKDLEALDALEVNQKFDRKLKPVP